MNICTLYRRTNGSPVVVQNLAILSISTSSPISLALSRIHCYASDWTQKAKTYMNTRLFLLSLSVLSLFVPCIISPVLATVINFDDMSSFSNDVPLVTVVTNGYQGLNWANFYTLNGPYVAKTFSTDGYYYGMVSASNVTLNGGGTPAEIDAIATDFNFLSTYITGAWNSNLNVEVQGFNGATMLYDTTVVASATSPTLFTFNYLDIDRLTFNSFGGQPAFGVNAEQFVMDNLTFDFVPEPSPLLLTAGAALLLWPFLKRKRA
jgi:hypothetical protein